LSSLKGRLMTILEKIFISNYTSIIVVGSWIVWAVTKSPTAYMASLILTISWAILGVVVGFVNNKGGIEI